MVTMAISLFSSKLVDTALFLSGHIWLLFCFVNQKLYNSFPFTNRNLLSRLLTVFHEGEV